MWVPENFLGLPDYAHGYFSQKCSWAFVPTDTVNVPTKFQVRNFNSFSDNRETQKIGQSPPRMRPRPFSPKILMGFCSDGFCDL